MHRLGSLPQAPRMRTLNRTLLRRCVHIPTRSVNMLYSHVTHSTVSCMLEVPRSSMRMTLPVFRCVCQPRSRASRWANTSRLIRRYASCGWKWNVSCQAVTQAAWLATGGSSGHPGRRSCSPVQRSLGVIDDASHTSHGLNSSVRREQRHVCRPTSKTTVHNGAPVLWE